MSSTLKMCVASATPNFAGAQYGATLLKGLRPFYHCVDLQEISLNKGITVRIVGVGNIMRWRKPAQLLRNYIFLNWLTPSYGTGRSKKIPLGIFYV